MIDTIIDDRYNYSHLTCRQQKEIFHQDQQLTHLDPGPHHGGESSDKSFHYMQQSIKKTCELIEISTVLVNTIYCTEGLES